MKQRKWLLTAAFVGLGMAGLMAFAPQAHAKCNATLEIKNSHTKDLKIKEAHIPNCKRKKKIKLKFYTKTVNNLKAYTTGSWAKGKKLTLTWRGEKNFANTGNK